MAGPTRRVIKADEMEVIEVEGPTRRVIKAKIIKEPSMGLDSIGPGTILKCIEWRGTYFTEGNLYKVLEVDRLGDGKVTAVIVKSNVHNEFILSRTELAVHFSVVFADGGYWR